MKLTIDGENYDFEDGTTVAAAIIGAKRSSFRRSSSGEARFPICGMGICYECRVTIDGAAHQRSCQTAARDGMVIETE